MSKATLKAAPTPTYGIVGSGRLARHLEHYLKLSGLLCIRWSRENSAHSWNSLLEADVILLAISDAAIEDFYKDHPELKNKACLHFSGSLTSAEIPSAHPLYTFAHELYDLKNYESIPFICEKGRKTFKDFFPTLPNPVYILPKEDKARYHALCVMSGNFTQILWQKFFNELNRWGLPVEAALPYLKRNLENITQDPQRSLTGPFVRNDLTTIQNNIDSLENDPYQAVYRAFWEAYKHEYS
ncbi:MAG: DUF2520 domain-containing protein [Proteobacteria bacterium]|nr:DUF2520 domain-containing protein [Pseudomonadota bacterium]